MKNIISIALGISILLSLAACNKDTSAVSSLPENQIIVDAINDGIFDAHYTDSTAMNNYMKTEYFNQHSITYDESSIYFTEGLNNFALSRKEDYLSSTPAYSGAPDYMLDSMEEEDIGFQYGVGGIVINGVMYSHEAWLPNSSGERIPFYVAIEEIKDGESYLSCSSNFLPYDDGILCLMDGKVLFISSSDMHTLIGEPLLILDDWKVVFDINSELENSYSFSQENSHSHICSFGIYGDYLVILDDDRRIWSVELKSGNINFLYEGNEFFDTEISVDGEYVYYVNDRTKKLSRVSLDGKKHDKDIFSMGEDQLMRYKFNISEGILYYLFSEGGSFFLIQKVPLDDFNAVTTLAFGKFCGVNEWVSTLYPIDDWVYFYSSYGDVYRVKKDGSVVQDVVASVPDTPVPSSDGFDLTWADSAGNVS